MKNKYTNKEYIKMYKNYKNLCTDMISKIVKYDNFDCTQATGLYKKIIDEFTGVDFTAFSIEELYELDFKEWDGEVILSPIWALDCFIDGTELSTISGETMTVGSEVLDFDVRMGVTAYGFNRSQLREYKIESLLEN